MKRIVIALLLISGASSVCRAQMLTYDAQNFVQALLGYLRDGETSAENAALFLEDIGISTEMLSSIREWNDRYREICVYEDHGFTLHNKKRLSLRMH